ncbi:uncharacterized protein BO80DRAFT_241902 [Aspergillus ibericus CBS 121593]|uniref:Uncharacterized protein n=1 Tax=Aspergillus ibericus CBS 121593 TaxID=1448316 RepID=A0A395GLE5_9EURO|nr:hypothetical protein BO80DRAFT_241902 [Aspergillus ibericus CBS 121593]RAK96214.1 hypothetical protein BO80DRAFT_241902 [Aspergillus ibericus CBS 121593]
MAGKPVINVGFVSNFRAGSLGRNKEDSRGRTGGWRAQSQWRRRDGMRRSRMQSLVSRVTGVRLTVAGDSLYRKAGRTVGFRSAGRAQQRSGTGARHRRSTTEVEAKRHGDRNGMGRWDWPGSNKTRLVDKDRKRRLVAASKLGARDAWRAVMSSGPSGGA